jgi:uncharacterized protein
MSDIIEAVKRGDGAAVQRLLDSDPSLVRAAENGVSAILLAVYYGKPEMVRLFLERGAELTFYEACAVGDADLAKRLLAGDPSLLHARSPDGFPAVGLAIFFRHRDLARFLIEQGADVNAAAQNAQRVAPVHAAAAVQDHEILRMLLERGADPNARQQSDFTPMHTAAGRGDIEMAKLLIEFGGRTNDKTAEGATPADVAIGHGHPEFAEWIGSVT